MLDAMMSHSPTKYEVGITSVTNGHTLGLVGLAQSVTNAVYNIDTGLMTITFGVDHGYKNGKFVTLTGIGMTCHVGSLHHQRSIQTELTVITS